MEQAILIEAEKVVLVELLRLLERAVEEAHVLQVEGPSPERDFVRNCVCDRAGGRRRHRDRHGGGQDLEGHRYGIHTAISPLPRLFHAKYGTATRSLPVITSMPPSRARSNRCCSSASSGSTFITPLLLLAAALSTAALSTASRQ